jgi:hypothetical protein
MRLLLTMAEFIARTEPEVEARTIPAWSQEERPAHVEFDDNELTHDLLDLRKSKYVAITIPSFHRSD